MSDDRALLDKFVDSKNVFNPDILDCIANLSNDEVFTPPKLVNEVLDTLPPEIWNDSKITFLDPACKSGVWLREITKRLIDGLVDEIPDLQERIDHILHKQVFGIAITELTSLLSRRSLYCSKYPNGKYSISHFDDVSGRIWYQNIEHKWKGNKCELCGANKGEYDRNKDKNNYAYGFIHCDPHYWEEVFGVKFDVIIGNPPYHLSDGGNGASAVPIYQKFVEASKRLQPRYLTMIIPARWMTAGRGLESFRREMLDDRSIRVLNDFYDSRECFSGVDIKGGVCYFLIDSCYRGKCVVYRHSNGQVAKSVRYLAEGNDDIFVRDERLLPIKERVIGKDFVSFESIVSAMKPYGLRGDVFANSEKYGLPNMLKEGNPGLYRVVGLDGSKRAYRYIPRDYPIPIVNKSLNKWKIFITRNWGSGFIDDIPSEPIVAGPGELCTETFIEIGPFDTKEVAENALSYLSTKFFRVMVAIRKHDQGASRAVYRYVPMQDFSKPWTDEELYRKYGLSQDEIDYIESTIKEMK